MKFYIVGPGPDGKGKESGLYCLVTEEGECINSWNCSDANWARHDLVVRHPDKVKEWIARFGEFKVVLLGEDDMTVDKLLELNNKMYQEEIKRRGV